MLYIWISSPAAFLKVHHLRDTRWVHLHSTSQSDDLWPLTTDMSRTTFDKPDGLKRVGNVLWDWASGFQFAGCGRWLPRLRRVCKRRATVWWWNWAELQQADANETVIRRGTANRQPGALGRHFRRCIAQKVKRVTVIWWWIQPVVFVFHLNHSMCWNYAIFFLTAQIRKQFITNSVEEHWVFSSFLHWWSITS